MPEIIIPNTAELFEIRKALTNLPQKIPDYAIGVKGVYLIERAERRPKNEDCEMYIFPTEKNPFWASRIIQETYPQSACLPNALAYYLDDQENFMHVGRVTSDGFIISKWGRKGHVYKHLPFLVPTHYGSRIRFYAPEA